MLATPLQPMAPSLEQAQLRCAAQPRESTSASGSMTSVGYTGRSLEASSTRTAATVEASNERPSLSPTTTENKASTRSGRSKTKSSSRSGQRKHRGDPKSRSRHGGIKKQHSSSRSLSPKPGTQSSSNNNHSSLSSLFDWNNSSLSSQNPTSCSQSVSTERLGLGSSCSSQSQSLRSVSSEHHRQPALSKVRHSSSRCLSPKPKRQPSSKKSLSSLLDSNPRIPDKPSCSRSVATEPPLPLLGSGSSHSHYSQRSVSSEYHQHKHSALSKSKHSSCRSLGPKKPKPKKKSSKKQSLSSQLSEFTATEPPLFLGSGSSQSHSPRSVSSAKLRQTSVSPLEASQRSFTARRLTDQLKAAYCSRSSGSSSHHHVSPIPTILCSDRAYSLALPDLPSLHSSEGKPTKNKSLGDDPKSARDKLRQCRQCHGNSQVQHYDTKTTTDRRELLTKTSSAPTLGKAAPNARDTTASSSSAKRCGNDIGLSVQSDHDRKPSSHKKKYPSWIPQSLMNDMSDSDDSDCSFCLPSNDPPVEIPEPLIDVEDIDFSDSETGLDMAGEDCCHNDDNNLIIAQSFGWEEPTKASSQDHESGQQYSHRRSLSAPEQTIATSKEDLPWDDKADYYKETNDWEEHSLGHSLTMSAAPRKMEEKEHCHGGHVEIPEPPIEFEFYNVETGLDMAGEDCCPEDDNNLIAQSFGWEEPTKGSSQDHESGQHYSHRRSVSAPEQTIDTRNENLPRDHETDYHKEPYDRDAGSLRRSLTMPAPKEENEHHHGGHLHHHHHKSHHRHHKKEKKHSNRHRKHKPCQHRNHSSHDKKERSSCHGQKDDGLEAFIAAVGDPNEMDFWDKMVTHWASLG
ncbi:expressed unknown protein [Seminavis robusta]|uniref:Uncharacterized protein n=1 Tax=Seminavis robusta TaxID=568900 RepID=A0A9N8EK39_9STRA|nr:expressed unknown protein [Seminavis robusta]|eukprot:Sro1235_g255070.1 n/a (850) ;mRNA; r:28387-30936